MLMRPTRARFANRIAALGPGLVFLLTVVGTGDLVANAALGAAHGYAFVWLILIGVIFRFIWLDTSARYVLVTGEGLLQGFMRLGRPFVWLLLLVVPILGHLFNVGRIVLFGEVAHLLAPLPISHGAAWYSLMFTAAALVAILRGGYSWLETFAKWLVCFLGLGLFAAAILSRPDPLAIARGLIPSIPPSADMRATLLMVTALIGTESGSVANLTYASFLRARGWRDRSALGLQRRDLLLSVTAIFLIGALTQIAAANTLLGVGARLENASDLVQVVASRLAPAGITLFALGLAAKIFSSAVGGTTGFSLIVAELGRHSIRRPLRAGSGSEPARVPNQPDRIFGWTATALLVSPLYVLFTDWTPVTIVLVGQSAPLVLMPLFSLGLVKLTRQGDRMGAETSGMLRTALLLLMATVSLWFLWRNATAWLG